MLFSKSFIVWGLKFRSLIHFEFIFVYGVSEWKSCPTLQPHGYTVRGVLQARILEWVTIPFSKGSSQPRDQTQVSCIAGRFFTSWATREASMVLEDVLISFFYTVTVHFSQHTTYWRDCLFSIVYSCFLCHRLLDRRHMGLFLGPLICISGFVPVPCCFDSYSCGLVWRQGAWFLQLFFFSGLLGYFRSSVYLYKSKHLLRWWF